jgi:hypothetical protein
LLGDDRLAIETSVGNVAGQKPLRTDADVILNDKNKKKESLSKFYVAEASPR